MSIAPFSAGLIESRRASNLFGTLRRDMEDLQRQLATGRKSETFGGLGFERRTSLDVRGKLSAIEGYRTAIGDTTLRINVMTKGLEAIDGAARDMRSDVLPGRLDFASDGRTLVQQSAEQRLKMAIDALNSDVNGRYLFAGRAMDARPVASYDRILNGDPDPAGPRGLKTLIDERTRAELGTDGIGRLGVAVGAANVTLTANDPPIPFGFELVNGSAASAGMTVTNAAGPPATTDFAFTDQPANGDLVTLTVRDKDGVTRDLQFTARTSADAGDPNSFVIGETIGETLGNLVQAFKDKSKTVLSPRAATLAATEFFEGKPSAPPMRVDGVPETATGMIAGTAANTVVWYTGDDTAVSARETAPVRIDSTQTLGAGAQANEEAIRNVLTQFGVLAAESFGTTRADAERFANLAARVHGKLTPPDTAQSVADIAVELGNVIDAMKGAQDRHRSAEAMLQDSLSAVEEVNEEEVAAGLLSLQTRLQASYQTTAMLSRLSLVNYL